MLVGPRFARDNHRVMSTRPGVKWVAHQRQPRAHTHTYCTKTHEMALRFDHDGRRHTQLTNMHQLYVCSMSTLAAKYFYTATH